MKKKCICCGIEKDISEYYSHPRTADGHLNKCKECCKKQNKDNREKHLEYYREKEDKTCKNFSPATYATCSSCTIDGKYTSCSGNKEKCKYILMEKKNERK